mmetsp:Transcript_884/g.989  ORF Transcript_884/g.989 Transcript_884/m.989 type:complete len:91 (-) Transcript_884:4-276(-)
MCIVYILYYITYTDRILYVHHPTRKTNKIVVTPLSTKECFKKTNKTVVTPLSNKSIVVIPSTKCPREIFQKEKSKMDRIYNTPSNISIQQ